MSAYEEGFTTREAERQTYALGCVSRVVSQISHTLAHAKISPAEQNRLEQIRREAVNIRMMLDPRDHAAVEHVITQYEGMRFGK